MPWVRFILQHVKLKQNHSCYKWTDLIIYRIWSKCWEFGHAWFVCSIREDSVLDIATNCSVSLAPTPPAMLHFSSISMLILSALINICRTRGVKSMPNLGVVLGKEFAMERWRIALWPFVMALILHSRFSNRTLDFCGFPHVINYIVSLLLWL